MKYLSDQTIAHLLDVSEYPDLSGTKYRLVRKLARGGMGTVFLVRDQELGREVAMKVLSDPDPGSDLSNRLLREAEHLARLEHPNIVPVHDVGRLADDRVFYVMKYIRGQRLDAWVRDEPSRPALLRMFQRICEAAAFAHAQGVIHRDLKPENVMVGSFGEAVVMDWGVAKALDSAETDERAHDRTATSGDRRRTAHGVVMGTPAYMAPEQARGEVARLDQRTDVYALGALLYFLLGGEPPAADTRAETREVGSGRWSPPAPLRQIHPGVPRPLASICARAMAEDPAQRYAAAAEMADDIDRFLDGRPVAAHREGIMERAGRLMNRYQIGILLILTYVVVRLLVLFTTNR